MEAKKGRKKSTPPVACREKNFYCNDDDDEPTAKAEGSKRKESKQGEKGNTKFNLNDFEAASKKGKLSKRRIESGQKREMTNSSILNSASVSHSASAGLCRFACSTCSKTFTSWKYLQRHEKKIHRKTIKIWNLEAYLFKASVHICKICSMKVLSDNQFLAHHFKNLHNMQLSHYRQQYNCNTAQNIHKVQLHKAMKKAKLFENVIGNFCTFRCPGCKNVFYSFTAFSDHWNPKVRKTCQELQDTVEWRTCIEEVVTHKCKICSKLILCDKGIILMHVRGIHYIKSIGEYAKKSGCTLEKRYRNDLEKRVNVNSKDAKTSVQIGNHCSYACHDCGYTSKCWVSMKKHFNELNHGSSKNGWHHYITETVLHQCKVCKNNVLNDLRFISNHINHHHHMSIQDYKILKY